jgi:hypothetical protein
MTTEKTKPPKRAPNKAAELVSKAQGAAQKQAEAKRRRARSLIALIQRRKQRITEDFYDVGEALRELLRKKLYKPLGHASFEALLGAHDIMSPAQARKLVSLVEHVPRDEALSLGQEKAYELVAYTAATPDADVPAELVRDDAKIGDKPLSKASVREIRVAAKQARATNTKAPTTKAARERARRDTNLVAAARKVLRPLGLGRASIQVKSEKVVITVAASMLERIAG